MGRHRSSHHHSLTSVVARRPAQPPWSVTTTGPSAISLGALSRPDPCRVPRSDNPSQPGYHANSPMCLLSFAALAGRSSLTSLVMPNANLPHSSRPQAPTSSMCYTTASFSGTSSHLILPASPPRGSSWHRSIRPPGAHPPTSTLATLRLRVSAPPTWSAHRRCPWGRTPPSSASTSGSNTTATKRVRAHPT